MGGGSGEGEGPGNAATACGGLPRDEPPRDDPPRQLFDTRFRVRSLRGGLEPLSRATWWPDGLAIRCHFGSSHKCLLSCLLAAELLRRLYPCRMR